MVVNAAFRCKTRARFDTFMREEVVWPAGFAPCENFDHRVLHRTFHNDSANCAKHAGRRPNISPCIPDATMGAILAYIGFTLRSCFDNCSKFVSKNCMVWVKASGVGAVCSVAESAVRTV